MKPIVIHVEAEEEARAAVVHYDRQRPGLGREFRQDLEDTIDRVRRMPQVTAPIDDRGTRKLRFRRFPYTLYYVDLDPFIWIAAVAHQKRRPGYWSSRSPEP